MASGRRLAAGSACSSIITRPRKIYICFNCQLRALSSSSSSTSNLLSSWSCPTSSAARARISSTSTYPYSQSRLYATDDLPPRSLRSKDSGTGNTWTDKLRKKLWVDGQAPGPEAFQIPGETPEERAERLREAEEERLAKEKEERDFENIRRGSADESVDGESGGSKEVGTRRGPDIVNDQEEFEGVEEENRSQDEQPQYQPATTWRGLRHIPDWKVAQGAPKPWYTGFLTREKIEDPYLVERAVQRALVEVWVLKQAGGTLVLPARIRNPTDDFESRLATGVVFERDGTTLRFTDDALEEEVKRSLGLVQNEETVVQTEDLPRVDEDMIRGYLEEGRAPPRAFFQTEESATSVERNEEDATTDSAEDVIAEDELQPGAGPVEVDVTSHPSVNQSYRIATFADPDLKFAVLKRVMQLTGTRFPDPEIPRLNNAKELVRQLVKPTPVKRLVDDLAKSEEIGKLPNVEIWEKRYTEKDREVEIGRWKLIEAGLQKRGLPLDRLKRSDGGRADKVRLNDMVLRKPEEVVSTLQQS